MTHAARQRLVGTALVVLGGAVIASGVSREPPASRVVVDALNQNTRALGRSEAKPPKRSTEGSLRSTPGTHASRETDESARSLLAIWAPAGWAMGIVSIVAGLLALAASWSSPRHTHAALRLDWYLPFLRKKKQREILAPPPLPIRLAQAILPEQLFANRETGKPGLIRKMLDRLGPSVLSSPVRRVVQAVCLVAFLVLFFYVCWPYSARPDPPGRTSPAWSFSNVDPQSGLFVFEHGSATEPAWPIDAGATLYLVDDAPATTMESKSSVALQVVARQGQTLELASPAELTPELLDAFLLGTGTWTLHETDPFAWPSLYADELARKDLVPAETFLVIDPLVSLSTAIAARSWVWSLACAAVILIVCVLIPRGFCGYLCPLGTTIDLFDWAIAARVERFRVADDGWWVHVKYYLLAGTLISGVFGVLLSGFVAAIPVVTRAALFLFDPLQNGIMRGWHLVPAMNAGHAVSIALFAAVLGLGFLRPRFWCKYVCPSGAVFSLGNLFRVTERKVEESCIHCNKCIEICPFDAIKPDFTTRVSDCTLCQSCGGVCPTHSIKFVERWNTVELKVLNDPPTGETAIGRRGFLSLATGSAAAVAGGLGLGLATRSFGARLGDPNVPRLVRPPGSVPEQEFLQMCIRCGECFKACPNNVLQAVGFEQGLEGLWTPKVVADWAGCESSCNACGQVCPTGAIRALPLEEKKVARMGLAAVNESTCLPLAGREECDLCVRECDAAGYHAIEFTQVHTQVDDNGLPVEGTGFLAPVVLAERCVGCGLCQTRCYGINVKSRHVLEASAIIIEAGDGKEDRLLDGSYVALREQEALERAAAQRAAGGNSGGYFVPDAAPSEAAEPSVDDTTNPFTDPGANPFE